MATMFGGDPIEPRQLSGTDVPQRIPLVVALRVEPHLAIQTNVAVVV